MLLTLHSGGYIGIDGRYFYSTARVLELSQGFLAQPLWWGTGPVLQSLADRIGETASADVLEGFNSVYTLCIRSSRLLHLERNPGDRLRAHECGMGRVLLATLSSERLEAYLRQAEFKSHTRFTVTIPCELRRRLEETRRQAWSCARGGGEEVTKRLRESPCQSSVSMGARLQQCTSALGLSVRRRIWWNARSYPR
jgi:IclR family pca regulon transcriptional regulator